MSDLSDIRRIFSIADLMQLCSWMTVVCRWGWYRVVCCWTDGNSAWSEKTWTGLTTILATDDIANTEDRQPTPAKSKAWLVSWQAMLYFRLVLTDKVSCVSAPTPHSASVSADKITSKWWPTLSAHLCRPTVTRHVVRLLSW